MIRKVLVAGVALLLGLVLVVSFAASVWANPIDPPESSSDAGPAATEGTCVDGLQDSGAVYRICMPSPRTWGSHSGACTLNIFSCLEKLPLIILRTFSMCPWMSWYVKL